jgi:hypothetical protein
MDRRKRSPFTRCRVAGTLVLALGLGGCNGNANYVITGSTGGSAAGVPAGTTGYVQASTSSSSAAFAAVFLLHWSLLNERWDRGTGMYGSSTIPAPPMDETRTVNTQDCTQPIEDWSANLKCR